MSMYEVLKTTAVLEDHYTANMRKMAAATAAFDSMISGLSGSGGSGGGKGGKVGKLGTALHGVASALAIVGAAAAATGYAVYQVGEEVIRATSEYETLDAQLRTISKSAEDAGKRMRWAMDFARKTPYELNDIIRAMVRLQSYGFEPMSGQLKTIGDFASAMGKDIQDAVEAVSDASNNEWERMKEFAVNREMVQRAAPDAFNSNGSIVNRTKAMMALFKIMEERGAGGMERRMDTIAGKWSNVQDAMWRTWVAIGQAAGPAIKSSLDWLIGKLDGIAEWAKRNGPMLQKTFTEIFKAGMFWAEKLLLKMAKLAAKLVGIAHDWQDIDKMKVPTAAKWLMKWGVVEGNMMGLPGATSNDIYDKWMKAWEQAKNAAPGKGGLSDLIDPLWGIQSNTAKTAEALEKMNPIMGGGALTKAWTAFARFRQNTLPGVSAGPSFATAGAGSMGPIQITIRNSSGGPLDAAVKAIAQDVLSQFASQLGAALKGSKRA